MYSKMLLKITSLKFLNGTKKIFPGCLLSFLLTAHVLVITIFRYQNRYLKPQMQIKKNLYGELVMLLLMLELRTIMDSPLIDQKDIEFILRLHKRIGICPHNYVN